ncbi:uncharacterized protein LOC115689309 [Syzygium oleosum]|uniref:uncharacterized protein LOC115689309 n=1 Tax=Syzygium oleosum TaxID=219896 RepID=UPI0011D24F00|nr:uncharacterized protein LOC115689309 [Syzygium oleosum]
MEGVGARLGRSSTRYGPATVFTGPVRRWKKKWVHVPPSSSAAVSNGVGGGLNGSAAAAAANGGNASHLVLYKWTPITQSGNTNGGGGGGGGGNGNTGSNGVDKSSVNSDAAAEEPPRRKFKYIPIALLEEEKDEDVEINAAEDVDDEGKPSENDLSSVEPNNKSGGSDEKPDINNIPMEVSEDDNKGVRQDLNESTLDLSLSFKAGEGNHDVD